jgi:hypothetical protein
LLARSRNSRAAPAAPAPAQRTVFGPTEAQDPEETQPPLSPIPSTPEGQNARHALQAALLPASPSSQAPPQAPVGAVPTGNAAAAAAPPAAQPRERNSDAEILQWENMAQKCLHDGQYSTALESRREAQKLREAKVLCYVPGCVQGPDSDWQRCRHLTCRDLKILQATSL